jgi:hypothetical protein
MTGKFLIESFEQQDNNCVAVVLIKAAILQYGMNRVFKKRKFEDHYVIRLRNGTVLAIAHREIRAFARKSRIKFRRARNGAEKETLAGIRDFVHLCFAVMIKNVVLSGFNGKKYHEKEAIHLLTRQGMNTAFIHELLGLRRKTSTAHSLTLRDLRRFRRKKAVLLYSDRHIVVSTKGLYDNYGQAKSFDESIPLLERKPARGWFELAAS